MVPVPPSVSLADELRARGLRLTAQRQLVLESVYRLGHATPDQVHAEVARTAAGVNITTVYRTLELLEELGLVTHAHLSHGAPTYHAIGRAAPALLLVCRLLQGLSIGGEYVGANILILEHAGSGRYGRAVSANQIASYLGAAAAAATSLFLTAALLLAVAPGPGMLYVLARSLAGGRREGVLSALGTFVGGMVHVLAAAAGVSVVLARSAVAFATVKYAGAAYLCFLGVRMILAAWRDKDELPTAALPPPRNPFWQGIATEVLNPKTALFFLSFIPQFVNREAGHVFAQFLALGAVSVTLNTSADLVVTMFAGPLGNRIRSSARFRRAQRTATGGIMIGLGTYLAVSKSE